MTFYIRKAIKVGPLRFNLSKSGIGVSAGIKGFRLGTGPRGNYIHMGRDGLYFRQSLSSPNRQSASGHGSSVPQLAPRWNSGSDSAFATVGPLQEIESASVAQMVDTSSADLLREMNDKRRKVRIAPIAVILSCMGALALFIWGMSVGSDAMPALLLPFVLVTAVLCWLTHWKDELRKTTVVMYDLDPDAEAAYAKLHEAFKNIQTCARSWHVEAEGQVHNAKYHAGASSVVKRTPITLTVGAPPLVKTNVAIPLVPVGKQLLAFMPDRLLVFEPGTVGAVDYSVLVIDCEGSRFIEDGPVPADATVVGKTWRYVNKKGGPDRRFSNNRELSICLYDQIHFTSNTGLNEVVQLSCRGPGFALWPAIRSLQKVNAVNKT